jgi:hypothetical protein
MSQAVDDSGEMAVAGADQAQEGTQRWYQANVRGALPAKLRARGDTSGRQLDAFFEPCWSASIGASSSVFAEGSVCGPPSPLRAS